MNRFEKLIRKNLKGTPSSDRKARVQLYQAAIKAIDALLAEKQNELKKRLAVIISKIETEYQASTCETNSTDSSFQNQAQVFNRESETIASNLAASQNSNESPKDKVVAAADRMIAVEKPDRITQKNSGSGSKWLMPAKICGVLLVAAVGGWLALNNNSLQSTPLASSDPIVSPQRESSANDASMNTMINYNFGENLDRLSTQLYVVSNGEKLLKDLLFDGHIQSSENMLIFAGSKFDTDTSKTYIMPLEIASTSDKKFSPVVSAGFVTFGQNDEILKGTQGQHRYFVNLGRLRSDNTVAEGQNFSITGMITGEDTGALDDFLPNTKSERVVIVIRPFDNEPVILKSIKLLEIS